MNRVLALVRKDSNLSIVDIDHIFCLISDIESEPLPYDAMPSKSEFFIHR